jgi:hypothetical protein
MSDTEIVKKFLDQSKHMVVAVTLDDNTPWAVPVRIRQREGWVFEWDSKSTTVHSRAIATHPDISLTIFSADEDIGLYAKATAEELSHVRRDDGYVRYRATVTQAWLNEKHIKRPIAIQLR